MQLLDWTVPEPFRNHRFRAGEQHIYAGIPFLLSPTTLSPEGSEIALELNARAGRIHIAHYGEMQKSDSPWNAAAYLVRYADGSSESIFATMRWNTGVFASEYFPQRLAPDYTWWGPPSYSRARAHLLPTGRNQVYWNAIYVTSILNPFPEKEIRSIHAVRMTGDERRFTLLGITLDTPDREWGVVEPDRAVFAPGETVEAHVMLYSPAGRTGSSRKTLELCSRGGKKIVLGDLEITRKDRFGYGVIRFTVPERGMSAGPVSLTCGAAQSSLLGLLPDSQREFQYTMITGGSEAGTEFEQIRRLGYDAVKIQIGWGDIEKEPGRFDWSRLERNVTRIAAEGLKIELRNHHSSRAEYLLRLTSPLQRFIPGRPDAPVREYDPCDPVYRSRLVGYYREMGRFAARHPEIVSINASYIVPGGVGRRELRYAPALLTAFRKRLAEHYSLDELRKRTGTQFASFDEIGPEEIWNDASRILLPEYVRTAQEANASLQREVAEAIRASGCKAHLTFNAPMHTTEQVMMGIPFAEYLQLGRDLPPGSPFHETSDRYTLSFVKWLAAKRTLNLPFGDEGCMNPPSYEQNLLAYQWMAMMQCWDAIYCQWWGGRPGAQNIAFIKPFHHMLYGAEYLPDQLSLALSLDSGYAESPELLRTGGHATTMAHYSLGSTLRALNLNADRYMIDAFPELDDKISTWLLIDDDSKALSPEFGKRIEDFIRSGGTYLATLDTDRLNQYAFFRRLGMEVKEGRGYGKGVKRIPGRIDRAELAVGKGRLVLLESSWATGSFDAESDPAYYAFLKELFTDHGAFLPLVSTDKLNVAATPYRAENGDILIHLINLTASECTPSLTVARKLLPEATSVLDHGTGAVASPENTGTVWRFKVALKPLESTVIRLKK